MTEPEANRLIDRLLETLAQEEEEPDYELLRQQEEALEVEIRIANHLSAMDEDDFENEDEETSECPLCNCEISVDDMWTSPLGEDICRWCVTDLYGTETFE